METKEAMSSGGHVKDKTEGKRKTAKRTRPYNEYKKYGGIRLTDREIDTVLYLFFERGLSVKQLAERFNVNKGVIEYRINNEFKERALKRAAKADEKKRINGVCNYVSKPFNAEDVFGRKPTYPKRTLTPEKQFEYRVNKIKGVNKQSERKGWGVPFEIYTFDQASNYFYQKYGKLVFLDGHHTDNGHVVYIPRSWHKDSNYPNSDEHRRRVMEGLRIQMPELYQHILNSPDTHFNEDVGGQSEIRVRREVGLLGKQTVSFWV